MTEQSMLTRLSAVTAAVAWLDERSCEPIGIMLGYSGDQIQIRDWDFARIFAGYRIDRQRDVAAIRDSWTNADGVRFHTTYQTAPCREEVTI